MLVPLVGANVVRNLFAPVFLAFAWQFVGTGTGVAEQPERPTTFPYQAYIAAPIAEVFGGPGSQYYATAKLAQGTPVEVHQATGRFLAIRPPAESFSWVPAADIQQNANDQASGIGIVARDAVASRVGSLLSPDNRNIVHVRLQRGERVRVLARVMIADAEWVQITPPAGEFRWIRAETISMIDPTAKPAFVAQSEPTSPQQQPPTTPVAAPLAAPVAAPAVMPAAVVAAEPQPDTAALVAPEANPPADSGWVQSTAHVQPATEPATPPALPQSLPQAVQQPMLRQATPPPAAALTKPLGPAGSLASANSLAAAVPAVVPSTSAPPLVGPFQPRIDSLELELSRRVTQSPNRWQFTDIELEAARLLAGARNPQEQAAARALAGRIDRFSSIAARHQQLRGVAPQVALTKAPAFAPPARTMQAPPATPQATTLPPLSSAAAPLVASLPAPSPLMPASTLPMSQGPSLPGASNAVGELRTVVSQRPDAPKFALVDLQGRVTAFLTPQAGVELAPLVGRRVAVSGQQGYMPKLRTTHIAATGATQVR